MILAIRKSDGAVFENVGCDGFNPILILEDLKKQQFCVYEKDIKLVFDNDTKFNEYLKQRV